MVGLDEDSLICDFAEVYHVLDWRALPVNLAATLACGLGPNSRIMLKISGERVTPDMMLSAMVVDELALLLWSKTKDGRKGRNRPSSVLDALRSGKTVADQLRGFDSADDFRAWREKKLKGSEQCQTLETHT